MQYRYSDTSKKLSELALAAAKLENDENKQSAVTASGIKKKTIVSFVLAVDDLKVCSASFCPFLCQCAHTAILYRTPLSMLQWRGLSSSRMASRL